MIVLLPVILAVFLLRSFAFEPFKIPSGSMMPTLLVGDLILVNKFVYGLRLPVINKKITEGQAPQRGDVMVFRYPPQPNLDYIKRVIGLPGDQVSYINKKLKINGTVVPTDKLEDYFYDDKSVYLNHFSETINNKDHQILSDPRRSDSVQGVFNFYGKENCQYSIDGFVCTVPSGHYFMMGDNRDDSMDSRYWGFVPEANIVGKAFFIWMNFFEFQRIGKFN
jgi:signal peptidase I